MTTDLFLGAAWLGGRPAEPIVEDDEGWIWLPMAIRYHLQEKRNRMLRDLMDNATLAR